MLLVVGLKVVSTPGCYSFADVCLDPLIHSEHIEQIDSGFIVAAKYIHPFTSNPSMPNIRRLNEQWVKSVVRQDCSHCLQWNILGHRVSEAARACFQVAIDGCKRF